MDHLPSLGKTATYARYALIFQLLLGGQARLTSLLTPGAHKIALSKATALQYHLPILFISPSDPERHSQFMGAVMMVSGLLLLGKWREVRLAGVGLAGAVLGSWVVPFWREEWEWYVPLVNLGLLGLVGWAEVRRTPGK